MKVEQLLEKGGLDKWFKEKWVDISRTKKDGSHPECGEDERKNEGYPKCVPARKAAKMTKKQKESASRRKRRAERTKKRDGKKPIYVKTKAK